MPDKNRSVQFERADETHDIACMIVVPISMERRARLAVPSSVRHHYVEIGLEQASHRRPAGSIPGQSMEQHQWRLGSSGSQVVYGGATCIAGPRRPIRHCTVFERKSASYIRSSRRRWTQNRYRSVTTM